MLYLDMPLEVALPVGLVVAVGAVPRFSASVYQQVPL